MDRLLIAKHRAYALLALTTAVLAVPSLATANSGGGSLGSPGPSNGTSTTATASMTGPVSASGDGITLTTNASSMLRKGLTFSGTVSPSAAGQAITIERLGRQTGWKWASTVQATVSSGGSFSATWHTNHIGRFQIRALIGSASSASAATNAPTLTITVFRSSIATLYGPGFYGSRTACGKRLSRNTIGVANRTLRCGSKVALYFHGRTMIVPVIDRGPYANGADWDLTMATGKALGMTETERIGAVSLPRQPGS
jgi:rare lipoprotein A